MLPVAVLLCAATTARATAPPPPDLVVLEQQMAQLHVNTERFSLQEEISFGELFGHGIPFVLILAGAGEASQSPAEVSMVAGILGLPSVQTRVIGDTVYTYRRQAAEIDGGRPWVRSKRKRKEAAPNIAPGGVMESDRSGAQGTFSKLVEELNGALAIEESGPVTVDDQRVTEFDATLDPALFLEKLKPQSTEPKHPLNSLFNTPETQKTPAKPSPPPTFKLELFIAPDGVPVRARYTFSAEGVTIAVRVDTLAINIPVNVTPPPARQTIDEVRLKRLERRRAERELRHALRACRRQRGKQRAFCRRIAKLKAGAPPRAEPALL
jgi:hypothetical protein